MPVPVMPGVFSTVALPMVGAFSMAALLTVALLTVALLTVESCPTAAGLSTVVESVSQMAALCWTAVHRGRVSIKSAVRASFRPRVPRSSVYWRSGPCACAVAPDAEGVCTEIERRPA